MTESKKTGAQWLAEQQTKVEKQVELFEDMWKEFEEEEHGIPTRNLHILKAQCMVDFWHNVVDKNAPHTEFLWYLGRWTLMWEIERDKANAPIIM